MKQSLLGSTIGRLPLLGHFQSLFLNSFHLYLILVMIKLDDLFQIAECFNGIDPILWIYFLAFLCKEGQLSKHHIIFDLIQ